MEQLRHALPEAIATWEQRLGLSVPKWTIRRMKTKWGSCSRETKHIWFNVERSRRDLLNGAPLAEEEWGS